MKFMNLQNLSTSKTNYRKLGNFHVEIIHVVNIHVDLFSWVYGTQENILT